MIFRWSIWGDNLVKNLELLYYSVFSFKKQFGDNHQYIIFTDKQKDVAKKFNKDINIKNFPRNKKMQFCITSKATWRKWCPTARLDINQDELFIDSDVFLLKYPKEVDKFLINKKLKFAIMDEFSGQSYQHGAMCKKATKKTPFVNAGFFVQKAGNDISIDLNKEYNWWKENIKPNEQTHHDEQGALAIALTKYKNKNELYIFPKKKYMIMLQ